MFHGFTTKNSLKQVKHHYQTWMWVKTYGVSFGISFYGSHLNVEVHQQN